MSNEQWLRRGGWTVSERSRAEPVIIEGTLDIWRVSSKASNPTVTKPLEGAPDVLVSS